MIFFTSRFLSTQIPTRMSNVRRTLKLVRKISTKTPRSAVASTPLNDGEPSAFILWSRTIKAEVEAENPGLSNKDIAEKIGEWCTSFVSWGYQTRVQQLSTGGQEICLVAQKACDHKSR